MGCFALPSPAPQTPRRYSFDHAGLELFELLLVFRAHLLEQPQRRLRLLFVDFGEREADVDEDPVPWAGAAVGVRVEEPDVHRAPHTGDIDLSEPVELVDDFDDLAGNGQAHRSFSLLLGEPRSSAPDPTPGSGDRQAPHRHVADAARAASWPWQS